MQPCHGEDAIEGEGGALAGAFYVVASGGFEQIVSEGTQAVQSRRGSIG
jgi:hypothetical protein